MDAVTETIEAPTDTAPIEDAPLPTVEELAAKLGWKPKDQWEGDESKYRGPVEFIEAGQHGKLVKEVKQLKETTERMARTSAQATARMLAEQEAEIVARFERAVEDGDKRAAAMATQELNAVQAERNAPDPSVASFAARNPWYNTDPEATDYAAAISARLASQGRSPAEQCDEAERAVRKRFPELFDEPAPRRQAPVVAAPSSRTASPSRREKGFADLPADARSAAVEYEQMASAKGWKYDKEAYAKTYWADHA